VAESAAMSLAVGTRLGSFEVTGVLGAGGMGEVYRARDTRLKRDVALKILPASFATDPDRLARFQREAEVLASLNHPNIAAIHGLEEGPAEAGPYVHALVMELVDGETLADRIARGAIPVDEALPIARQIAEALEVAHEQGIIHRDLKPANIKVKPDGTVKVLDFGLAKLNDLNASNDPNGPSVPNVLSMSPTITSPALMTGVGVLLGTAAYMSPEQAKGRPADKRSDIWAFGCVLYEMLTGKRAFEGDDVADTLANVLKSQPDWTALPDHTPGDLRRLLRRCTEKDRKRRLFDIGDARLDIEDELTGTAAPPIVRRISRRERLWWMLAVGMVLLAAGSALVWERRELPPAAPMQVEITTPPTSDPISLALSPDGRNIVFVGTANGRSRLWVRSLDSPSARPLDRTEGASFPFWSADSRSVGFFADTKLKRIDLDGGLVQVLTNAPEGRGGTWNAEGTILFTPNSGGPIFRIPSTGGQPVAVTRIADGSQVLNHRSPFFLPDRRHFLYYVLGGTPYGSVMVGDLGGAESKRLLANADAGAVFLPSGHLVYSRQRALFAQRFDINRLEVIGDPVPLGQQVAGGPNMTAVSASATGLLAYRTGAAGGRRQLAWIDRSGKEVQPVGESGFLIDPSLSRDDRYVALRREVDGNSAIWLLDIRQGTLKQFTPSGGSFPIWSPDGSRIVFSGNTGSVFDLFIKPFTRAGREEVLLATSQIKSATDWSPDGRVILYRTVSPKTGNDLFALAVDDRKPVPIAQTGSDERDGQFSPDGKWLAFVSNESGRPEVYVQPFPGPGGRQSISSNGGGQPRWRRDGKELFYIGLDGRLMAVPIELTNEGQLSANAPVPLFVTNIGAAVQINNRHQYEVSHDGQRFLMNTIVEEAAAPITLLLNWRPSVTH
jgi:eukaryotic-like serine/threonine-protein kinase